MAEVNIVINGRTYNISCDEGQQQRVLDLGHYVDQKMKDIACSGAATNENHLLVLTSLILADEVYDLLNNPDSKATATNTAQTSASPDQSEAVIAGAIDQLASRIDHIATRLLTA